MTFRSGKMFLHLVLGLPLLWGAYVQAAELYGSLYFYNPRGHSPATATGYEAYLYLQSSKKWIGPSITDGQGRFAFYDIPEERYVLQIYAANSLLWKQEGLVSKSPLQIVLQPILIGGGGRPLNDRRVQEAVLHAMNWAALKIVTEAADVPVIAWDQNTDARRRLFNRARAKQLLAEAGYLDGFQLALFFPPRLNRMAFWMTENLKTIGIKVDRYPAPGHTGPSRAAAVISAGRPGLWLEDTRR